MGGREDNIVGIDVVITTYGYSGVGVDFPDITALVIASPRKTNINQLLGWILRDTHQEISRDIIDIIDPYDIFINQAKKRYEFYKKRNYNIFNYRIWNMSDDEFCNMSDDEFCNIKSSKKHDSAFSESPIFFH